MSRPELDDHGHRWNEDDRQAFLYWLREGLGWKAIGVKLGRTQGSVRSWWYRERRKA